MFVANQKENKINKNHGASHQTSSSINIFTYHLVKLDFTILFLSGKFYRSLTWTMMFIRSGCTRALNKTRVTRVFWFRSKKQYISGDLNVCMLSFTEGLPSFCSGDLSVSFSLFYLSWWSQAFMSLYRLLLLRFFA